MPKRMHDTSMDRGFGDESISMNSASRGVNAVIHGTQFSCKRGNSLFFRPFALFDSSYKKSV